MKMVWSWMKQQSSRSSQYNTINKMENMFKYMRTRRTRRYNKKETRKVDCCDSVVFPEVLVLRPLFLDRWSFHMIYLKNLARAVRRWLTGSIPDKSLCISHYNGACLSPCLWPRSQTGSPRALWTAEGTGSTLPSRLEIHQILRGCLQRECLCTYCQCNEKVWKKRDKRLLQRVVVKESRMFWQKRA